VALKVFEGGTAGRRVVELPLLGRNPLQLVSLAPGVIPAATSAPPGGGVIGSVTSAKIGGGLAQQNGVLTDGAESRGTTVGSAYAVPLESVAEFRIETATYAAEFGRAGGGVVQIVTKSGTNDFHGALYEFLRNDHLNANGWQNNRNRVAKGLYQRNEFGTAVGGRIVRDRSFFFLNYEGVRDGSPIQFLATTPTVVQKQGDFSQTLNRDGSSIIVYDPLTTRVDPSRPGGYNRTAFPGNRIPQDRIHPVSQKVEAYWPDPNRTGEGPARFNNYFKSGKTVNQGNAWLSRIDHIINSTHRLFGRFSGGQFETFDSGVASAAFPARSISSNPTRSGLIALTSTFTPQLLGEFRVSYTRLQSNSYPVSEGFDVASLGFAPSFTNNVFYRSFPEVHVQQYQAGGGLSISSTATDEVDLLGGATKNLAPMDTWQTQYHVTFLHNRHKLKFGTELELLRLNVYNSLYSAGRFFFDRQYTQGPDPTQPTLAGGSGFASFLLGVPIDGSLAFNPRLMLHQKYHGFYFQDDFRITNRLTLNLGLRYEYTTPSAEKFGQVGTFELNATEPITGAKGVFSLNRPGAYQSDPNRKNFGPRVGLAYQVNSKTVLRAAGAIFYAPYNSINPASSDFGSGTFVQNTLSLGPPNPLPFTPPVGGSWSNPFAGGLNYPDRTSTFAGQNMRADIHHHPLANVADWSFNIQRMLTSNLLVEVGYIGSKTTHLSQNRQWNQNSPLLLPLGSSLQQPVPNPFYGKITSGPLSFPTIAQRQLLRPYPQYLDIVVFRDPYGNANYNAFTLRVEKQYSRGHTVSAAYTGSKNIADTVESNAALALPVNAMFDRRAGRGPESNDIPQRLVLSYIWDVPFGKGRPYLAKGPASYVLGNWQLSGITVFQRGRPLLITAPDLTGLFNFAYTNGRANRFHDPVLSGDQKTTDRYFDITAFAQAPPFTLPNDSFTQPRLRAPGRRNFDFSLIKNIPFREHYNVQFRAEFFNLFNTPGLDLRGASMEVSSPQFGKVLFAGGQRNIQFALRVTF
jgi:hypothetical protein